MAKKKPPKELGTSVVGDYGATDPSSTYKPPKQPSSTKGLKPGTYVEGDYGAPAPGVPAVKADAALAAKEKAAAEKKKEQEKAAAEAANRKKNQESIGQEIETALAPQASELTSLPGKYNDVMSSINNLPSSSPLSSGSPYASALSGATNATTNKLVGGELGIEGALQGIPGKVSAMESNLPYADILSTVLQSNKQKLLYGSTAIPFRPTEAGWSSGLKNIYNYLSGTTAGTAPSAIPTAGGDTLPGISSAVKNNNNSPGSLPGFGSSYGP